MKNFKSFKILVLIVIGASLFSLYGRGKTEKIMHYSSPIEVSYKPRGILGNSNKGSTSSSSSSSSYSSYSSSSVDTRLVGTNIHDLVKGDRSEYITRLVKSLGDEFEVVPNSLIVYGFNQNGFENFLGLMKSVSADLTGVTSAAQAEKQMVWVEVPVWRLSNGKKVPGKEKVKILKTLAKDLKEIFEEIYNGPEKFPIKSIGGYSWRGNGLQSLHSQGRAIDINPDENPQIDYDGKVLVGKKWEPGVNPYSITPEGDVVKAFRKHGWTWGGEFTKVDYMHFGFAELLYVSFQVGRTR